MFDPANPSPAEPAAADDRNNVPVSTGDPAEIAFVQKVANAVPDILYVYDVREGRNIYCNREIATVLGYSPQEVLDFGTELFTHLLHPDDTDAIAEGHQTLASAEDGAVVEVSYRMCHSDNSWHWLRSRDTVFARDSQGNVMQKLGVAHDVTSERQAKEELTEAVERYSSLVSVLTDFVWETNANSVLTYISPQATRILGYTCDELLGKSVFDFMPPYEAERANKVLTQATVDDEPFQGLRHVAIARDGHTVYLEVSGTPMFGAGTNALLGYRGVSRDITNQQMLEIERKELEAEREALLMQTRQRAEQDPLTGLLNRTAFQNALHRLLAKNEGKENATHTVAILLLDLDNLKFFNDTYGHSAGDDVLMFVANALRSCCSENDVLARRGGDEFAILLPDLDKAGADARLNRIKKAVSQAGYRPPQRVGSSAEPISIPLTISGGSAIFPHDGQTTAEVFEKADDRLYLDKTNAQVTWADTLKIDLAANLPGFASLDALVSAVAAKDRYTLRHSEDVLIYAALIGEELGLSLPDLHALKVAALLHDVGKIGVADRLLRLPGPLSLDEYEAIKLHASLGAALVASAAPEIVRQMPTVVPAIRHHHERWDGANGGYPDLLTGESIPLHARILAVADAFSSMTTDRPHRKGMTHNEANSRLRAGAGTQWESRCARALILALENADN